MDDQKIKPVSKETNTQTQRSENHDLNGADKGFGFNLLVIKN